MSYSRKKKLALIIPAHNEELAISTTITTAIASGQPKADIFVVSDASTDRTRQIAIALLGRKQVMSVHRSGKALAIQKVVKKYDLASRYRWIHIADGDGLFEKDYFKQFRRRLNHKKFVAATGYIKSLKGGWICRYRAYEYFVGLQITRRLQKLFNVIPVIAGPTSCYRSDIFKKLNFNTGCVTEDLDVTFQIHRQKLGKIQYIPAAKVYTQDPQNLHDYTKQLQRWYRGYFQAGRNHRIGTRLERLDAYLGYITIANLLMIFYILALPAIALINPVFIAFLFISDVLLFMAEVMIVSLLIKRLDILGPFPAFYLLRLVNFFIFFFAFVEVMIMRRFGNTNSIWSTEGRRYHLALNN